MFKNLLSLSLFFICFSNSIGQSYDLSDIKKRGELRQIGVPYAGFVTGQGDGLSVDIAKAFAKHLGVQHIFVKSTWGDILADLSGKRVKVTGNDIEFISKHKIKGDLIGTGLTMLPWREKLVDYSKIPTFPTQIWLLAKSDLLIKPITPSGSLKQDIIATKKLLKDYSVLCKAKTCLDPKLYNLEFYSKKIVLFEGTVNDLIPASALKNIADTTILDVPDALIALQKWPTKIKIVGPISEKQLQAFAFPKTSPNLKKEFEKFFKKYKESGQYMISVKKYYHNSKTLKNTFPEFFKKQ